MASFNIQQDLWTEISKGRLPGMVVEYLGIGVSSEPHSTQGLDVVWNANTTYPTAPPIGKVSITSTDADDTLLGTGARTVMIHGTDATNSKFITETVNMNGTTAVLTTQDFSSVTGLSRIATVGSLGRGDGNIRGRMGGIIVLHMDQGFTEGSHAFLQVPLDTTAFIYGITYSTRFRCEFLTQDQDPTTNKVFNDIDRSDIATSLILDYSRTPRIIQPGSKIRTVMRCPHYFNKAKVNWRLALIPTAVL